MAIDIGSRLELLVDEYLIDRMDGVELTLHKPIPREVAIVHDEPWEGNTCFYHTVFRDGNLYRMYYRGAHYIPETRGFFHQVVCYAESSDGIHWNKPDLGVVEFNGSRRNNIVWDGFGAHNFTPFRDNNPECRPDERYKAIASGASDRDGLYPFKSPDGIHWSLMSDKAVITEGAFDSQNLAFWDTVRGCYAEYHRGQWDAIDGRPETFVRDVMTCTSPDFLNWTQPEFLEYPGAPIQHLYTNQITPYLPAPHIYMGFPKRFVPPALFVPNTPSQPHAPVQVPEGYLPEQTVMHTTAGYSDGVFMTSRDGASFKRWGEAFLRPGPQTDRWGDRDNFIAWGILQTKSAIPGTPNELSLLSLEGYKGFEACRMRRFTVRKDGFVSLQARLGGGEMVTKPLVFDGGELVINFSTSAAGSIRFEVQDLAGTALEGLALEDCPNLVGDDVEHVVSWTEGGHLGRLSGKPVRLRLVMRDADLYSFRFR